MNILVISHMYPNNIKTVYGIFVHEQAKALKKLGCNLTVINPVPLAPFPLNKLSRKWDGYSKILKHETINDIDVFHTRTINIPRGYLFEKLGYFYFLGAKKIVEKLHKEKKFDLIHCHTALPDGLSGTIFKKQFNIPIITFIHGQDFQQTINKNNACRKQLLKVLDKSDRIITVSDKLRRIGLNYGVAPDKITTVHNGVDISALPRDNENISTEGRIILSVGNLKKTKGHDITIRAFKEIHKIYNDTKLFIIGDGPERHNLSNLISSLNLDEHVYLLGPKNHPEVMEYMQKCDIFTLPSWEEGFGVVYVEAMANEKPIIGCKTQGIEDIIEHEVNGLLCEPKSTESLIHNLSKLLEDPSLCKRIGQAGATTVKNGLTWEKNAEKVIQISKELTIQ